MRQSYPVESTRLDALRPASDLGTMEAQAVSDPEATHLILQALFDIKADVHDIHGAIFGGGDDEETEDEP